ncbi:MAG: hypothetical protein HKN92_03150, partial [Chitinophagales bacterium]|nr:hypothetical protein [Chitinophagales bacterium]
MIAICTISYSVYSQQVTGKVLDETSAPIENAYVGVNRTKHTHTDHQGTFSLEAGLGDTLEIICLGYENHKKVLEDIS